MFNNSFGTPFGGGTGFGTSSTFGQQSKLFIHLINLFKPTAARSLGSIGVLWEPASFSFLSGVGEMCSDSCLVMKTCLFVLADAGFGTAGGFGASGFGTTTNTGGLFGTTQNKPGGFFRHLLRQLPPPSSLHHQSLTSIMLSI